MLLLLALSVSVSAGQIWGVTGNGSGSSQRSELFTLDTSTMTITKITTTASGILYSDIAVTPSGYVYTVGNVNSTTGFNDLMRLNPSTGAILGQWDLPLGMNSLTAKSDTTLLGVQWGSGVNANLIEVQLNAAGAYLSCTNLGRIDLQSNSGGDIALTPNGDYIAATNSGGSIYRIPVSGGSPNPAGATLVCNTSITGVGALAYDFGDPLQKLYAGSYNFTTIYTLNLATGVLTNAGVVNPTAISYSIYGMDVAVVPEPMTVLLLGVGIVLARRIK